MLYMDASLLLDILAVPTFVAIVCVIIAYIKETIRGYTF
jgi:hypothetical protein